jgi:hypothetical protein
MAKTPFRHPYLYLLVFPLAFLIIQILLKLDYKWFFLSYHDPVYAFLFNGLNLAQGNMQLGLAVHPGTPLHCLIALNLFISNLLSGGSHMSESVLMNTEYYLNIISYEIVAFNTLALIIFGVSTFRQLKNLPLSLALQLTPFISLQAFSFNSIVMLEPLLLCIEIFLLVMLAAYTFGNMKSLDGRNQTGIAILIALGIATKIVFIPVMFLPFFAIEGIRNRLRYVGIVLLSLSIFLIPIYPVLTSFFTWINALFTHTGPYGSGRHDLFDFQIFTENLYSIFIANYLFTIVFFLIVVTTLISFLPSLKPFFDPKKRKMLFGLTMVFVLNVLMVAKHYSSHYLVTSYNLVIYGFMLWLSLFPFLKLMKYPILHNVKLKISAVFLTGSLLVFSLIRGIQFSPSLINPRLKALEFVESSVGKTQRIIVLEHSGPFIETAMFQGLAYSGGMKPKNARFLKSAYPVSYFYNIQQDIFHDWINEYNLVYLLSRSPKTYLYYASRNDTFPPILLVRLQNLMQKNYVNSLKTSYKDPESTEYIYEIESNTQQIAGKIIRHESVYCNFEALAQDTNYFFSSDSACKFDKVSVRSADASFSGKYSIKLNKENPYGSGTKIILKKGYYKITIMRHSDDGDGHIVAAGKTGTELYKANAIATTEKDGWDSVELTVDIPEKMIGEEMSVYLWYPGNGTCYFDDLNITYFEVQ